jgi:hypothetical protein
MRIKEKEALCVLIFVKGEKSVKNVVTPIRPEGGSRTDAI